jgi:hypothetical protein
MTEEAREEQNRHKWYSRPVIFVTDVNRALHFYVGNAGLPEGLARRRW